MRIVFLFLTLCFYSVKIYAQSITGFVYDAATKEPLVGASVYFDNTTIGTSTDFDGAFELEMQEGLGTGLVASFVGYASSFKNNFDSDKPLYIYLKQDSNLLEEVVLTPDDDWSRELKLEQFRKHYLGSSERGVRCSILNEDDLILVYSKKRKRMYARAKAPLQIQNNALQYLIQVELKAFGVGYSTVSRNKKNIVSDRVTYKGFNLFKSLDSVDSKFVWDARRQAYLGSVLHFMRSMSAKNLPNQGYRIRVQGKFVEPAEAITVIEDPSSGGVKVKAKGNIEILFRAKRWSIMQTDVPEFQIDKQGNHSPVDKVRFGGDMGDQRMGDTLPLDFLVQKNL